MAATAVHKNRNIRKEALREQLSQQKHVQHVIDIADKLSNPDSELESTDIQRYAKAADIKLKLIDKYLPSLKQSEINGSVQHDHTHNHEGLQDANTRIGEILGRGKAAGDTASKPH